MKPTSSAFGVAMLLSLVMLPVSEARAQRISADPTAAQVAYLLRNHGGPGRAVEVLTQVNQRQTQQRMDEVADTLAAIAVSLPGNDVNAVRTRSEAMATLVTAGVGRDAAKGINEPLPYAGAADRLMRMVESAQDIGVRAAALTSLRKLPNETRTLAYYREIASSQNQVAYLAVSLLCNDTGADGVNIGRELFLNGSVKEPRALESINRCAGVHKWR